MQWYGFFLSLGFNIIILALFYVKIRTRFFREESTSGVVDKVRDEINEMIIELNQVTDRNVAIIENRLENLRSLIETADKRIKLLKKEAGKEEHFSATYSGIVKKTQPPVREPEKISRKDQVLDLSKKGFSSDVIASRVGATIGEVELIISLGEGRG